MDERADKDAQTPLITVSGDQFKVTREQLMDMMSLSTNNEPGEREESLSKLGDTAGLIAALQTNIETGIETEPATIAYRISFFGTNHPIQKKL